MPTSATPKPPLSRAYTLKASKIPNYFNVLIDNPEPEVFDTAFLAKSGFRYAIDRAFIDILTNLGFLTEAGHPTRRYRDFLDHRQAATVLRLGLAEAYAGLLAELPQAAACPELQIMETVSRYFEGEINDMAAGGIAATFLALTRYAAGLDNGSAIAGAALRPAVATMPASKPVAAAPVASGPATEAVSKPVGATQPAPEPATASQAAAAPKPAAAPEPVAAVSAAFAGAPVVAPESVAQAGAASPSAAPAPKAVAPTEAFAPTNAEAASPTDAPALEPAITTKAETPSISAAPLAAVAQVPAPATVLAAAAATPAPEATPIEAAAVATPPPSLAEAEPAPSPVAKAAPTPGETAPEPATAASPGAAVTVTPIADPERAAKTDGAPDIAIAAFSGEPQGQAQDSPQRPVIHITLPASTDVAVYDAIFASLKRHLLSPGDQA